MDVTGINIFNTQTKINSAQVGKINFRRNRKYLQTIPGRVAESQKKERADDRDNYTSHYFLPLKDTVVAIVEVDYPQQVFLRERDERDINRLWRQLKEALNAGAFQNPSKKSPILEVIFQDPFQNRTLREVEAKIDDLKNQTRQSIAAVIHRGPSLDQLLTTSQELEKSAVTFDQQTKKMKPQSTWPKALATVGLFSTGLVTGTVGATGLIMGKITGLFIACCAGGYALCFLMLAYGLYQLIEGMMSPQETMTTALRASLR